MGINWVVFFAQIVNLFVLVWLLKKFLYRPIVNAVEKRQAEIISKVNKAKEEYALAEAEHKQLKKKLTDFEKTKQKRFDEITREIDQFKNEQMAIVTAETDKERKKHQNALDRQVQMAHAQIRDLLADNFMLMAQKIMTELSTQSPFEQSLELFLKRLKKLSQKDIKKIKDSYKKQNIIFITSSETLSKNTRQKLAVFLSETYDWTLPLKMDFQEDTSLGLGLEMTIGDITVQWHLRDYLDEYQTKLNNALASVIVKE